jgi:hypothetical protein
MGRFERRRGAVIFQLPGHPARAFFLNGIFGEIPMAKKRSEKDIDLDAIAYRIKAIRNVMEWRDDDGRKRFAKLIGVNDDTWRDYEEGRRLIPPEHAQAAADAFKAWMYAKLDKEVKTLQAEAEKRKLS